MTTFLHNSEVLHISIEEMKFSPRTYNCLKRAGLNSLEDLANKNLDDYMRIRNLGRRSLHEIEERVAEYGIKLLPAKNQQKPLTPTLEEKSYKYFISYAFTSVSRHIQFGNAEVSYFKKIESLLDIDEVSKDIAANKNMDSITILNYVQFI